MTAALTPLLALVRKDLILFLSDRRALVISLALPIVIAAFFGSLFGGSARTGAIDIALVQQDGSAMGAKIAAGLRSDPQLHVTPLSMAQAEQAVRKGEQKVAIVLPAGFGEAVGAALSGNGGKPAIALLYDPSQPVALAMAKGILTQQVMSALSGRRPDLPFTTSERQLAGGLAEQGYSAYAHAFAGMGVQFILFMGIDMGVGILLARRSGVWNRLLAAPVSLTQVLLARAASGAIIAFALLCAMFAVAVAVFGVHIASLPGFIGIALCFGVLTASLGLLIAAFGKTPDAARRMAMFAVLVMVLLGGAWIPSFLFPAWMQQLTMAVPTRWAVDGLDAVTWRGMDALAAAPAMGVQLGFALVFGLLAVWKFRREQR